jgi:tripartite-type tricarboxylate transporter receptor subunit TctC
MENDMKTNIQSMPQQRHINRIASTALAGLICLLGTTAGVHAQSDYPNRPIKIVVPYTAGGNIDITARVYAKKLSEQLGQQVIIENKLVLSRL